MTTITTYRGQEDETINEMVCDGETFLYNGMEYEEGTYTFTDENENGCDYTITLNVTNYISPVADAGEDMILECEDNNQNNCETAFAMNGNDSTCFLEDEFDRWGWTNYFEEEGTYIMELWAGAAQCDTDKGELAGEVIVEYEDGFVTITYNTFQGYVLDEAHLYVGNEAYPFANDGSFTVAPGLYPYNSEVLNGESTHSFGPIAVSDIVDNGINIIAHAVVCNDLGNDDPDNPTSNGVILNGNSDITDVTYSWTGPNGFTSNEQNPEVFVEGVYTLTVTTLNGCSDSDTVEVIKEDCENNNNEDCETAFAMNGSDSRCFLEDEFDRWGWTNYFAEEGTYTMELWAGAAQCDINIGELVGEVIVEYEDGFVTITYNIFDGYELDEAQLYVGNEPYPYANNGNYTVAPGQYPYNVDYLEGESMYTYEPIDVSAFEDGIYVIAHAVTCTTSGCDDSDNDGVCDADDVCPGYDDTIDSDNDGIPDGCDTDSEQDCETAFALNGSDSSCFLDNGFDRWGWTNYFEEEGTYTMDLWAGAAQCDTDNGELVGEVIVEFEDGFATITYNVFDGYALDEAQIYVGGLPYPLAKKRRYTVAPGQYPYNIEYIEGGNTYTYGPIDVSDFNDGIYVIAHAVTCETTTSLSNKDQISFEAYPIPFDTEVNFRYNTTFDTDVTFEIYTLKGILLKKYLINDSKKNNETVIKFDMSDIDNQLFIVKMITNRGVVTRKIVSSSLKKY
ncbi:MAG: T9SS type A sorting domain-containing protein [Flavobacteriaceae bacterium]|nr:T9SS type A sorting domain-containing protein [Flavobacteriaceae bacterium]